MFELDAAPSLAANSVLGVSSGTLRLNYTGARNIGRRGRGQHRQRGDTGIGRLGVAIESERQRADNGKTASAGGLCTSRGPTNKSARSRGPATPWSARPRRRQPDGLSNRAKLADDPRHGTTAATAGTVTLVPSGSGSIDESRPARTTSISAARSHRCRSTTTAPRSATGNRVYYGTLDIGNNGLVIAYGSGAGSVRLDRRHDSLGLRQRPLGRHGNHQQPGPRGGQFHTRR